MGMFGKSREQRRSRTTDDAQRRREQTELEELHNVFNRLTKLNPQWQGNPDHSISCALANGYYASVTFAQGDGYYTLFVKSPEGQYIYYRQFAKDFSNRVHFTNVNPRAWEFINEYFWPIFSPYWKRLLADEEAKRRAKETQDRAIVDKFWGR